MGSSVFDSFSLRVVFERDRTGFEETKDLPTHKNSVIAGRYPISSFGCNIFIIDDHSKKNVMSNFRYHIVGYLGSAAFSKAVKCFDMKNMSTFGSDRNKPRHPLVPFFGGGSSPS